MSTIFKKLNLKDEGKILVMNAPASFETQLELLEGVSIERDLNDLDEVHFSLAFVIKQNDLDEISAKLASMAHGDALLWFAYPKGSSKKYKCEFNRDTGWDVLKGSGFQPVYWYPSTKIGQRSVSDVSNSSNLGKAGKTYNV